MAEPQPTLPPVTDAAAPRSASISACTHHDDLSAGSSGKSAKGVTGASGDQQLFTTEPCDDVLPLAVPPEKPAKLSKRVSQWLAGFFRFVGPGFVMTIAFLDPGNLAADVNQGVLGGYTLMWVTLYSTLMAWVIQSVAALMGIATKRHLAQHCYHYYPLIPRYFLFIMMELAVLATDMMEVIGGAVALYGMTNQALPMWAGVLITCTVAYVLLSVAEFVQRDFLQWFMAAVLGVLIITFCILFAQSTQDVGALFKGIFVPSLSGNDQVQAAVGCVGAIIMPYNLFLGSAIVLTRPKRVQAAIDKVPRKTVVQYVWVETALVLLISLMVNMMAIAVFATSSADVVAMYHEQDGSIGILDIGKMLGAQYGSAYEYIWYVGLLTSAQASTMTTTYAGGFMINGFLNLDSHVWWSPYIIRTITLLPALAVACIPTTDGYATLTNWLNQINAIVVPYAMIPLFLLACTPSIMGKAVLRPWLAVIAGAITMFIISLNVYSFIDAVATTIDAEYGQGLAYTGIALYILSFLYYAVPVPVWTKIALCRRCHAPPLSDDDDDVVVEAPVVT